MGSVYKYHQSASENWLPAVGTAILAVSSDRPLSEHDLELIRELTNHTPNIVLLLTRPIFLRRISSRKSSRFFSKHSSESFTGCCRSIYIPQKAKPKNINNSLNKTFYKQLPQPKF